MALIGLVINSSEADVGTVVGSFMIVIASGGVCLALLLNGVWTLVVLISC